MSITATFFTTIIRYWFKRDFPSNAAGMEQRDQKSPYLDVGSDQVQTIANAESAGHPPSLALRIVPLAVLVLGLLAAYGLGWHRYVSLSWLADQHGMLLDMVARYPGDICSGVFRRLRRGGGAFCSCGDGPDDCRRLFVRLAGRRRHRRCRRHAWLLHPVCWCTHRFW
ncbi:hypothetical protein LP421_17405 [Rhizobium sp. RCAM05350]|nr:hypothetical protein LP421_17405 [Rhizobium sp. RCAM05350]